MSVAVIQSRALRGLDAPAVSVEVHLANGLPAFNIEPKDTAGAVDTL